MGKLCEKGSCEKQDLQSALRELVTAIDIKWSAESDRKREAALSPRIEAALSRAKELLGRPDLLPVYATKPVE